MPSGGLQACGLAVGRGLVAAAVGKLQGQGGADVVSGASEHGQTGGCQAGRARRRAAGPTGSSRFNARSMSFSQGEQRLMDSLRAGLKAMPQAQQQRLAVEVQGVVGQQGTHRRIHALFNGQRSGG